MTEAVILQDELTVFLASPNWPALNPPFLNWIVRVKSVEEVPLCVSAFSDPSSRRDASSYIVRRKDKDWYAVVGNLLSDNSPMKTLTNSATNRYVPTGTIYN